MLKWSIIWSVTEFENPETGTVRYHLRCHSRVVTAGRLGLKDLMLLCRHSKSRHVYQV